MIPSQKMMDQMIGLTEMISQVLKCNDGWKSIVIKEVRLWTQQITVQILSVSLSGRSTGLTNPLGCMSTK